MNKNRRATLLKVNFSAIAFIMSLSQSFVATAASPADVDSLVARQAIAANVASFSYRDQGRWEELRKLFTADGTIAVSWYDGPIDGFIEQTKKMAEGGKTLTKHQLSSPRIAVCGARAISETDVTIMLRSEAGPLEVDITSFARFFDTFERSGDGSWRMRSRIGIYEKDRIDSVGPSVLFALTYAFLPLSRYPRELKHLAYGIERSGLPLASRIILAGSEEERQLKRDAWEWSGCSSSSGDHLP
jgi:hypothetical protein